MWYVWTLNDSTNFEYVYPIDEIDENDRNMLINLIAIIIGSPDLSNLRCHMFTPAELVDSYIPGFLVNKKLYLVNVIHSQ